MRYIISPGGILVPAWFFSQEKQLFLPSQHYMEMGCDCYFCQARREREAAEHERQQQIIESAIAWFPLPGCGILQYHPEAEVNVVGKG